jgi:hypothetical protein
LFSRADVGGFINSNFEAAWEMVRPVPTIRIDFGNGHVATRTLHGNIATYACTADRQVVDVLPGIYTPVAYMAALGALGEVHAALGRSGHDRQSALQTYHRERAELLRRRPTQIAYARAVVTQPPAEAALFAPPIAQRSNSGPFAGGSLPSGGFQGFGGGGGFKGGGEWRVEQIVVQAPGNVGGVSPRGPRPRPGSDLADWPVLAVDTWQSETLRRLLVHDRLADTPSVRPDQLKRWLYKEVLHADLDDPYLGLGDALFGDDVFRQDQ